MVQDDLKARWVSALRSGEFLQGRSSLYRDGAYCCLGVLCKIAGADMSGQEKAINGGEDWVAPTAFIDASNYTVSDELDRLLDYFGINTEVEASLIIMNDRNEKDFKAIADWIETHDLSTGNALALQANEVSGS